MLFLSMLMLLFCMTHVESTARRRRATQAKRVEHERRQRDEVTDGKQRRSGSKGLESKRMKVENKHRQNGPSKVQSKRQRKNKSKGKRTKKKVKVQRGSSKKSNEKGTGVRERLTILRDAAMNSLILFFDSQSALAMAVARVQIYIEIDMNKDDYVRESILLATALLTVYRVNEYK